MPAPDKELRLAVVMSGGVSLAVWMGGIAHSLLRWTQKPEDYWCPTKPSLDVIAGTSAGGLNGVFLAAALAWDIPHEQFLVDVRNAWLRLGSLERLLRSPFDADPLSLFDGEEKYRKEVESVLLGWWASSQARPADNEDFRIHLVVPTTLLRPNIEAYYDDLGTNFVEPTNAGTFTFTRHHFTEERYIEQLALAARASSAFPVAFDPAFVPAGDGEFPDDITNFKGSRWVADGGLIVNRPLRHALDGIARQKAAHQVDRWMLYVIPDPEPVTAHREDGSNRDDDNDKREEPLSLAGSLGRVAAASFSQSLTEDLREWERQRSMSSSQKDYRYWLAGYPERSELAAYLYQKFKRLRAEQSAKQTVRGLSAQFRRQTDIHWERLESVLLLTRSEPTVDWHPQQFPPKAGNGRLSLIGQNGSEWDWGVSAVEYMAQVVLDLVRELCPAPQAISSDVENILADARETIHDILEFVRAYRRIDADFWSARFQALDSSADEDVDREETLGNWAASAWVTWPAIDPSKPDKPPKIDVSTRRTGRVPPVPHFPDRLDQHSARVHLGSLARALALTYLEWRSQAVVEAEIESKQVPEEARVVAALDTPYQTTARSTDRAVSDVLTRLLEFWIVQVASSPQSRVWEQPIRLAHFSADSQNPLAPRFKSASDKLTGVQLAHFGAFYKGSWRANDWMWGRLDGTQHVLRLVDALALEDGEEMGDDPGSDLVDPEEEATAVDTTDDNAGVPPTGGGQLREWMGGLAERTAAAWNAFTNTTGETPDAEELAEDSPEQDMSEITGLHDRTDAALRQILSLELVSLARSIAAGTSEGALLSPEERAFVDEVELATEEGRVPVSETPRLLGMAPVGKLSGEIKSDQFTRTVTHTAAVAGGTLSGARSGLGPLRQLFLQMKNVVLLPFYLLAQSVTAGGLFARTIGVVSLVLAVVLVVIDLMAADLPTWLLALSWVVLAFWSLFAISRSSGSRLIFAVVGAVTVLAVGGIYLTQWVAVGGGDSRCAVAITDLEFDLAEFDVIIDPDECAPVDEVAAGSAERSQTVRNWLGLVAVAALAWQLLLSFAPRTRHRSWPTFSEGATFAVIVVVLVFPPTDGSRGWWFIALAIAAIANLVRSRAVVARPEDLDGKRSRSHGWFGLLSGFLVGGVVVGASGLGVRVAGESPPVIESVAQNPAWALVAVVVIPLLLSFAWDTAIRVWKLEPRPAVRGGSSS